MGKFREGSAILGRPLCQLYANIRQWAQESLPQHSIELACFVIKKVNSKGVSKSRFLEDQEKGDVWAGLKVMYVLSSTEYNWKLLSCRKLYVKYPTLGSLKDTECLYKELGFSSGSSQPKTSQI